MRHRPPPLDPRSAAPRDCSALLLPLFRSLTVLSPVSAVWKNADSALAGIGDVDWMVPAGAWDAIIGQVGAWAAEAGLGPVIVCRHIPDGMFVIALDHDREFFQLDVRSRVTFRGATVFRAEDLESMTAMDPRGFRRLRPGAEGALKLVLKGLDWGGRPRPDKLRSEGVLELIDQDPVGVRQGAALFGLAGTALVAAAESYRGFGWDRRAMLTVEAACSLRALREPGVALARARFRAVHMKRCPVLQASVRGRRHPPADYAAWLARVEATHHVFGPAAGRGARPDGLTQPGAARADW